ncbi:integrase catalytic domain-containing protein [Trichonephila clavipes]|nr:integrase catalytic domain-containing protein [Trichonephila clavipes]
MSAEAKRTSKLIMLNVVDATFKAEFFQKFSSRNKLKRVVAYCLRFVKNCSPSACKKRKSFLTTAELNEAEKSIVKFIQCDHFFMQVSYLSAGNQLPSSNKLMPLTPFYDDSRIIRVGGRLKNAILADSQKHPNLLPKTDHIVNLIISDYHLKLLHAGPQLHADLQTRSVVEFGIFLNTTIPKQKLIRISNPHDHVCLVLKE